MKKSAPPKPTAALIIAGGRGTRFWPESRADRPKPLFAIDGKSSLLGETIARTAPLIPPERIFVLVAADQRRPFARAVKGLIPSANLIIEPEGRGTAVAIAYGAAVIGRRLGAETVVAVMPADHYMTPAAGFRRTISEAVRLAQTERAIVVLGVTPTRAESGYGYQQIGRAIGAGFKVDSFVEKPDAGRAAAMVSSGQYLWNAGLFVLSVATLTAALEAYAPGLAAALPRLARAGTAELAELYRRLEFDSFDRVVVEKSANVLGVRARFRWHDVGSWEGLWEALRGKGDNVTIGNVILRESNNVLARAGDRLMVLLGCADLVAIDTGDALLIAKKSRSQDIREITSELARRGLSRYL